MVEITFMVQSLKKNKKNFSSGSYYITGFIIAAFTLAVYIPSLYNGFVNWDDNEYVYENKNIQSIDLRLLKWIFTLEANPTWHPLTLLSLAGDYSIWKLNPMGYHLTNIFIHSANTLLVFIVSIRLIESAPTADQPQFKKKTIFAGAVTSLLFGIHPMHVESVAWISERKDVLCGFFYLLTILTYLRYIQYTNSKKITVYIICLTFFSLSLLSKPMAVTLPLIFLILDFYPYKRLITIDGKIDKKIFIEKIPFIILTSLSAMITISAQQIGGALAPTESIPFISRLFLAADAYIFYLFKLIIPYNLAPFYPMPNASDFITIKSIASFVLLMIISLACCLWAKRNKFVATTWFYYVVTLIPVIGLIKVGEFAAADRYTYLPSLAPFLMIGLGLSSLYESSLKKMQQVTVFILLVTVFIIMTGKTLKQITIWHDSITLWSHEIRLFPNVAKAYHNRSEVYGFLENYDKALADSNKAIEIDPVYADAYYNRGTIYYSLGDYQRAIADLSMAIKLKTRYYEKAYHNRGLAYQGAGNYQQAINDYNRAIELNPQDEFAYSNRGNAYFLMEDHKQAINDYDKAIEINPRYVDAYNNRGYVYYILGNTEHSINDLKKAIDLDPEYAGAYDNLGQVYSRIDNDALALYHYRKAASLGSKEAQEYLNKLNKESINK